MHPKTVTPQSKCINCGSKGLQVIFDTHTLPLSNLCLAESAESSLRTKTGPIALRTCNSCGHVFNIYPLVAESDYATTSSSHTWFETENWYQSSLPFAERIIESAANFNFNQLIEIGSGSGRFLRYMASRLNIPMHGYDSQLLEDNSDPKNLLIHKCLYTPSHTPTNKIDTIYVLRHVLEHLSNPQQFLRSIISNNLPYKSSFAIEVPNLYPTIVESRFQDFVHEHISYYSVSSLSYLLASLDLDIIDVSLSHSNENITVIAVPQPALKPNSYELFTESLVARYQEISSLGHDIVLWGAGGRGATIASILYQKSLADSQTPLFSCVDSDTRKQGLYVPSTPIRILDPSYLKNSSMPFIVLVTTALGYQNIIKEASKLGISQESIYLIDDQFLQSSLIRP